MTPIFCSHQEYIYPFFCHGNLYSKLYFPKLLQNEPSSKLNELNIHNSVKQYSPFASIHNHDLIGNYCWQARLSTYEGKRYLHIASFSMNITSLTFDIRCTISLWVMNLLPIWVTSCIHSCNVFLTPFLIGDPRNLWILSKIWYYMYIFCYFECWINDFKIHINFSINQAIQHSFNNQIKSILIKTCANTCGKSWWGHQVETFSELVALCAGNSPVTGKFPPRRPVTGSFEVFFDLHPNKRLCKQTIRRWFEIQSHSLWLHCN